MPRKTIVNINEIDGCQLTEKPLPFNIKYLKKGIEILDDMSRRHSKVMQTRLDFRYPDDLCSDGSNKLFSRAFQSLMQELKKEGCDPQYIARREQKSSDNPHCHVCIMVNGNVKQSQHSIIEKAERHWGNALGMDQQEVHERQLVYPCNTDSNGDPRPNGYRLVRGAETNAATRQDMIRQMSYLSKAQPEDITPSTIRKFFTSQTRKKKEE